MAAQLKTEFEYFQPEPILIQVERSFYREYTPISALQNNAPIDFSIPGSEQLYLDLSRSYLYVRAKITNEDGTNIPANAQVGPINNTIHSLFSNVDVELNGKSISDANGLYPYRAQFETILTYNEDAQQSHLQAGLFWKDTAGHMNSLESNGGNAENHGLRDRAALFAESREVEMVGRLHADIFHQAKCIPQNVGLKIKLTPTKDAFRLITPAPDRDHPQVNYRVQIVDARMVLRTLQVGPATIMAHEKVLLEKNMRFPLRRVTMKHLAIPRGQTSILHDNIYLGTLPRRIVVGFLEDQAMSGSYQQNPFNFQHFGINHLALYVNGEMVPQQPYQPNFTTGNYLRDYLSIFKGTDT